MKKAFVALAAFLAVALMAGVAYADFSPQFTMALSDTKAKANPNMDFHMEFDAEDEEIGLFTARIPKGFNIASDEEIEQDDVLGGGEITIQAGFACRPDTGAIPLSAPVTVTASFLEKDRTDEEADAGVHSVWFLDLEPLNRVRLRVTGSPARGWTVSGAPDPSDNTCNPLIVDLTINGTSEAGVPVITNPKKPGKYVFKAEISSQDSASVAKFTQPVKITR
ncbi:MAG: hypothetical protein ACRDKT_12895 [Actinomycetota bacterium]